MRLAYRLAHAPAASGSAFESGTQEERAYDGMKDPSIADAALRVNENFSLRNDGEDPIEELPETFFTGWGPEYLSWRDSGVALNLSDSQCEESAKRSNPTLASCKFNG